MNQSLYQLTAYTTVPLKKLLHRAHDKICGTYTQISGIIDSAVPVMQLVMTFLLSGFGTYISQITFEILSSLKYLFNLHIYSSKITNAGG